MTTMLERAARALCAWELLLSVHEVNEIWNDLPETKRAAVANRARAVLMAMREPDDDMKESAGWSDYDSGCWAEGIDAILRENK